MRPQQTIRKSLRTERNSPGGLPGTPIRMDYSANASVNDAQYSDFPAIVQRELTPTEKRAIAPVRFTITGTASRVNENGTLSGLAFETTKGPKTFKAVSHPASGGAIWLKVESLEGLEILGDTAAAAKPEKKKLF